MNNVSRAFLIALFPCLALPADCQNVLPPLRGTLSTVALIDRAAAPADTRKSATSTHAERTDYDVIIRDGRIVDGSGNPWVSGDLAIRGDRIAAIGKLDGALAKRVIDAKGLVVSPGFIDMLGQSELALLIDNRAVSKLSQGITTEITGEGGSIAPQTDKTIAAAQPALDHYK